MQTAASAARGLLQARERRGSDSMKWRRYGPDVLPMWVADMDFAAAAPIIEAITARLEHGVFGYSLPSKELVETCVAYFARRWNYAIKPEWIVFTPGLGVALHTVTRYVGDHAKGVLVPEPIYPVFRKACPRAGRRRIDVPLRRDADGSWKLGLDELRAAARSGAGAAVLMLCNPHNPNGRVFPRAELERLAEFALSEGLTICADEVHADLILDEGCEHVPIASLGPEVEAITLTLQSPSKAFNVPGLNFAVAVIADPKLRELYRFGSSGQVVDQLNPFGMAAAAAAWSGSCDGWLEECVAQLRDNHATLHQAIKGIAGVTMDWHQATYLAWLDVAKLGLADPHRHCLAHGLALSNGEDFGAKRFLRLNFGCPAKTLAEGIDRFAKAVEAARR